MSRDIKKENDPLLRELSAFTQGQFDFAHVFQLLALRFWVIALIVTLTGVGTWAYLERQPPSYAARAVLLIEQEKRQFSNVTEVSQEDLQSGELLNTIVETLKSYTLLQRVANAAMDRAPEFVSKTDGGKFSPEELIANLQGMISVTLRRGTRLIDITIESENPATAKVLAALFVEQFVHMGFDQKVAISKVANTSLREEAERLKKKLQDSETTLQQYKEANQSVSLQDDQNIVVAQLKDLNTRVTEIRATRLAIESDIEQLGKIDAKDSVQMLRIGSVANLPEVSDLRGIVTGKESEFAALKERYLPKHPDYIRVASELSTARHALGEAILKAGTILRRNYETARDTETKMLAELQSSEKRALELNRLSIPYNVFLREVDSDRALYETVVKRLKETTIQQGVEELPYRILEEPRVSPVNPQKLKTLLVMLAGAVVLAIGLIIALDFVDPHFRTVTQLETVLATPVIGVVPALSRRQIKKAPMLVVEHPESPAAEAFRSLRASLSLVGREDNRKVFLVTSALPLEGKSFISTNLAAAFAQQGLRTLLIDADLRRPTLERLILGEQLPPQPGLADYLSGHIDIENAIWHTSLDTLFLLPAGGRSPCPAELVAQPEFSAMLAALGATFDRIVIDSAPVNAVSDSLLIAPHVHGICLVVRSGKTPRKAVERAFKLLRQVNGRVIGTVFNSPKQDGGAEHYYASYGDRYETHPVGQRDRFLPSPFNVSIS